MVQKKQRYLKNTSRYFCLTSQFDFIHDCAPCPKYDRTNGICEANISLMHDSASHQARQLLSSPCGIFTWDTGVRTTVCMIKKRADHFGSLEP